LPCLPWMFVRFRGAVGRGGAESRESPVPAFANAQREGPPPALRLAGQQPLLMIDAPEHARQRG
jgi:hypothetical protein